MFVSEVKRIAMTEELTNINPPTGGYVNTKWSFIKLSVNLIGLEQKRWYHGWKIPSSFYRSAQSWWI